jgi:hypothetical protein
MGRAVFKSTGRFNYDVSANSGSLAAVYLHQTICLAIVAWTFKSDANHTNHTNSSLFQVLIGCVV